MKAQWAALFLCLNLMLTDFAKSEEKTELSENDQRILENGEIRGFRRVAGTILAVVPGLGIGHAVHGRYEHRGWIFTLGELACVAFTLNGVNSSEGHDSDYLFYGISGFLGFKIWEFVDSIVGPRRDNRRYRILQPTLPKEPGPGLTILPVPLLSKGDAGQRIAHLGIGLNWSFH